MCSLKCMCGLASRLCLQQVHDVVPELSELDPLKGFGHIVAVHVIGWVLKLTNSRLKLSNTPLVIGFVVACH